MAVVHGHLQLQLLGEIAHQMPLQKRQQAAQQEQQHQRQAEAGQQARVAADEHIIRENLHQQRHAQPQQTDHAVEGDRLGEQRLERHQKLAKHMQARPGLLLGLVEASRIRLEHQHHAIRPTLE